MRITYKLLKKAVEKLVEETGKPYRVVPFPGDSGYNLVLDAEKEGYGFVTVRAGLSIREMASYLDGLIYGLRMVK